MATPVFGMIQAAVDTATNNNITLTTTTSGNIALGVVAAGSGTVNVTAAGAITDIDAGTGNDITVPISDTLAAQIRQGVTPDVYAAANTTYPEELFDEGLLTEPVIPNRRGQGRHVAVKEAVFPFARFPGADATVRPLAVKTLDARIGAGIQPHRRCALEVAHGVALQPAGRRRVVKRRFLAALDDAIAVGNELRAKGYELNGIRLDSGISLVPMMLLPSSRTAT